MSLKNVILSPFSRNTIKKPTRFTQNLLNFVKKGVGQPFLVHFTRNTIKTHSKLSPGDPLGASIWSRTSPAGPPGRPGWLALPGWPLGRLAGQAGVLAGQERPQKEESPWLALTGRRPARPRSGRHDNSAPPLLSPQVGYLV